MLLTVPLQNVLCITDEVEGLSVFGDRCHDLFQEHHGDMPQLLLEFLTGGLVTLGRLHVKSYRSHS